MKEIAKLDRAAETLRESQALYHSLVQQLPVGMFRKDAAGRYVLVNSEFCRLHGKDANHFLGKTPQDLLNPGPAPSASLLRPDELHYFTEGSDHHEQIMRTGRTIEYEEHYRAGDGAEQFFCTVRSQFAFGCCSRYNI